MKTLHSKKGFYLVSPFLGFFFFLITVSISSFFITENNQAIDTAKAGEGLAIVFTSYAIQADAFDVYFQNYLQDFLNGFDVGPAYSTAIENELKHALREDMNKTYTELYQVAFGVECKPAEKAWSLIAVSFNGQRGAPVLTYGGHPYDKTFTPDQLTAVWPLVSRYTLDCKITEPPIESRIAFDSRWYILDGSCICCQRPSICGSSDTSEYEPQMCPTCVVQQR